MEDRDFDKFIREKMDAFQPGDSAPDWDRMSEALQEDEDDQRHLALIKGLELLLVLTVAISLWCFRPSAPHKPIVVPQQMANMMGHDAPDASWQAPAAKAIRPQDGNGAPTPAASAPKNKPQRPEATTAPGNPPAKAAPQSVSRLEGDFVAPQPSPQTPVADSPSDFRPMPLLAATETAELPLPEKTSPAPKLEPRAGMEQERDLPQLRLLEAGIAELPRSLRPTINMPQGERKGLSVRTGYQVALDLNQTKSSYDSRVEDSFERKNLGFTLGWRAAIGNERWEVETGLAYNFKSYHPRRVMDVSYDINNGFEAESLEKLRFNTFSVPLDLRFYLGHPTDKWKLYLAPGASFNVVAFSNYDRHTYGLFGDPSGTLPAVENRYLKSVSTQRAGLFHGEALKRNFFVMASLAFGLETAINQRSSFFAQPKFSYYMMPNTIGIGPNEDQFNTFSLELGVRRRL